MRIGITGATGFVASGLVPSLLGPSPLASDAAQLGKLVLVDTRPANVDDPRVKSIVGDIADPAMRDELFDRPFDVFFHLAAVPGGAVAADYDLGWRVNVEATVALFEALAAQQRPARVVYASSIGVFGVPLPRGAVDDDTLPLPTMSYGAQKLIGETLIADFSRRGLIDGLAPRLPGIVARPRVSGGHLSAYMSNIFHALAAGEEFACPVSANATSWFMSRKCCVENLIHAAALPASRIGARRAFNLPALHLSMAELVEGIAGHCGRAVRDRVHYTPDMELQRQFGAYPPIRTGLADDLGFRHDGTATALVANALELDASATARGAA